MSDENQRLNQWHRFEFESLVRLKSAQSCFRLISSGSLLYLVSADVIIAKVIFPLR